MSTQDVLITVLDDTPAPVEGMTVSLLSSPQGYLQGTAVTDGSGVATFSAVESGAYLVSTPQTGGWSFQDTAITVTDAGKGEGPDQEFEVSGTQLSITPNNVPTTCRVFGMVGAGLGVSVSHVVITQLPSPNKNQGGSGVLYPNTFEEGSSRQFRVADDGLWEADLEVGRFYRIEVLHTGFVRSVRIPSGFTTRNVMDLPQLLLPSEYPSLRSSS